MSDTSLDLRTRVVRLTSQYPEGLIGLPGNVPTLSWATESSTPSATQLGYEIQCSTDADFHTLLDSRTESGSEQVEQFAPGGTLTSREIRHYRVRVHTAEGRSEFSPVVTVEAGLLEAEDFSASAIGDDSSAADPAPLLRKEFSFPNQPVRARLYIGSRGLNDIYINGVRVNDEFLNPGWTAYDFRLNVATYDVTALLSSSANAIGIMLGDGWWRGKLAFAEQSNHYGTTLDTIAQLEVRFADDSTQSIATDGTWKTASGSVRFADIYDGCTIDFGQSQPGWSRPGFDDSSWITATVRDIDRTLLAPRIAPPVREVGRFVMTETVLTDRVLLSASQNVSGWVELTVDGKKGDTVVVRHAEVLEPGPALHTIALRTARATDHYILDRDGRHILRPAFTFHGFQHADVVSDATVVSAVAVAISSDTAPRGSFLSSDVRLNRLHENVVWSQRDNFVGVPTDCPQRDERLGWTGDAQAFAYAANTLFDTESFWRSWLIDLSLDQDDNGDVGAVIPDLLKRLHRMEDSEIQGRAGWADAATIVPWSIYETFGSREILTQQLESIRRWVAALDNRRAGQTFLPTEFQFGDWCDPDAPSNEPWKAKVSADYVANSFFARSADIASWVEELVGEPSKAAEYKMLADELKRSVWSELGRDAQETTAGLAIGLEFEIIPAEEREAMASKLAAMVAADDGKITTGFLGTPLILHALSKAGHFSEAYTMLMRRKIRSWLFQVDQGATTIWERWDAIGQDGSIHSGDMSTTPEDQETPSMLSFNHYAYGAVVDWVYRNVGGLAPAGPGYREVLVAPRPAKGFSFCRTSIDTRYGHLRLDWELTTSGLLVSRLRVPFGSTAIIDLPSTPESSVVINGATSDQLQRLKHGDYLITVSAPRIVDFVPS